MVRGVDCGDGPTQSGPGHGRVMSEGLQTVYVRCRRRWQPGNHSRYCSEIAMALTTFSQFCKLPPEIRDMVWAYALPEGRVLEVLDAPRCSLKTPAEAGLMFADQVHESPPHLTMVCQESRAFVFHRYKAVTFSGITKYLDPARDTILLESYLLNRRLLRVLDLLARIPSIRNHVHHFALGTSYGFSTGILHPLINGKMTKRNMKMFLGKLSRFPRLRTLFFVAHQQFRPMLPSIPALAWSYQINILCKDLLLHRDVMSDVTYQYDCCWQRSEFRSCHLADKENKDHLLHLTPIPNEKDTGWPERRPTRHDWKRFQRRFSKAMSVARSKRSETERTSAWPAMRVEGSNLLWESVKRDVTCPEVQTSATHMVGSLLWFD